MASSLRSSIRGLKAGPSKLLTARFRLKLSGVRWSAQTREYLVGSNDFLLRQRLHERGFIYNRIISMRLHLLFTWHRSRMLPKLGRFENAAKSGAFSKRCGFICRVNSETASIWIRLLFWREICIVQFSTQCNARLITQKHHDLDFLAKTVPCKHFLTASILTRFRSHETVSMWNRVRVNAA